MRSIEDYILSLSIKDDLSVEQLAALVGKTVHVHYITPVSRKLVVRISVTDVQAQISLKTNRLAGGLFIYCDHILEDGEVYMNVWQPLTRLQVMIRKARDVERVT